MSEEVAIEVRFQLKRPSGTEAGHEFCQKETKTEKKLHPTRPGRTVSPSVSLSLKDLLLFIGRWDFLRNICRFKRWFENGRFIFPKGFYGGVFEKISEFGIKAFIVLNTKSFKTSKNPAHCRIYAHFKELFCIYIRCRQLFLHK